jgi:sugar/nucleoside kinase (ribokinase family)
VGKKNHPKKKKGCGMSSIVVVGSMAFDSVETPSGKEDKALGGSANYFSIAASYFCPVQCVSVVGEDYSEKHLELLRSKKIDTEGIQVASGKTFFWAGRYGHDLNDRDTLDTQLNVFEGFEPELPSSYRDSKFLFLGNIMPSLQLQVLSQMKKPKFVALDTMNFWIEGEKETLIQAISKCHALIINEQEVRQLTGVYNLVEAARIVRNWGPQILVVKQGEYGALLFDHGEVFSLPGLPLAEVKDPTGAGDSFAGGFVGYLASQAAFSLSTKVLRRAVVYGSVMASLTVQDFSFKELLNVNPRVIEDRYKRFSDLTEFAPV